MFISSKIKQSVLLLGMLVLLFSLAIPAFAETVEQTEVQEVLFTADIPVDFNQVIVITATSVETGYIYSYYLRPESNYETFALMPYGEYTIAASVSPVVDGTDDGTVYLVQPETERLVVKKASYTPALAFIVEGYTDTEQGGETSDNNSSSSAPPSVPDNSGSSGNSSGEAPDASDKTNNSASTDQSPNNNSEDSANKGKSSLLGSLVFSCLAILIFFVCGYLLRRRREG